MLTVYHICSCAPRLKRPGDFIASCLELAAADHQPYIGLRVDPLLQKFLDFSWCYNYNVS